MTHSCWTPGASLAAPVWLEKVTHFEECLKNDGHAVPVLQGEENGSANKQTAGEGGFALLLNHWVKCRLSEGVKGVWQ